MKAYQFWATFHYGGWSITFRKDIDLPVYPNSDMVISDGELDSDSTVKNFLTVQTEKDRDLILVSVVRNAER